MTSDQRVPSAASSIWPRSSPPRPRAARAIQKIIQVTKRDRDDREAAADQLLGLEGEAAGAEGERRAEGQADRDRQRDAGPDPREQVSPVGLDEVGDEDAHDERSLEPLTQTDQVVGEHGRSLYAHQLRHG